MDMSRRQKWLLTGAASLGIAVGAAGLAGAATTGSSSTATTAPAATSQAPSSMPNRPNETALTGDTAAKVKAAAEAAVPGGTVLRVENDSDGSAYEAHVRKADGTFVTLKIDASFKVTDTVAGNGCGPGGPGAGRPDGRGPNNIGPANPEGGATNGSGGTSSSGGSITY